MMYKKGNDKWVNAGIAASSTNDISWLIGGDFGYQGDRRVIHKPALTLPSEELK